MPQAGFTGMRSRRGMSPLRTHAQRQVPDEHRLNVQDLVVKVQRRDGCLTDTHRSDLLAFQDIVP